MFIDTHCHLSKEDYDDIERVILENRNSNIKKIIVSGCTIDSINESLEYAKEFDDVFLTIGFHPSEVNSITDLDIEKLLMLAKTNPKIVGIGEIGLDYHYGSDDKIKQIELFKKQMNLAKELKLPVVIHSRDAVSDTINVLKMFPDVKGVIHCFNGSLETAKEYINMGYYLGIGGVITFKNCNLWKVVKELGAKHIVFETDSPYLTPVPFRGKINSSKYIKYIAEKVSEVLDINCVDLALVVEENTYSVFDLD